MGSLFDYSAFVNYDNLVRIFDSGQPVRNDDTRAALSSGVQSFLDDFLTFRVQGGSCLNETGSSVDAA